jgi:hypothetical protein
MSAALELEMSLIIHTQWVYEFQKILRNTAVISLNNINWLVYITDMHCISHEGEMIFLNVIQKKISTWLTKANWILNYYFNKINSLSDIISEKF